MHPPETDPGRGRALRQAPPGLKLGVALAIIVATALMPRRPDALYLVPAALLLLLWPMCGMGLKFALRRLLVVEPFILGLALLSLLTPSATPLVLSAIIKSNLCVFAMLLL